MRIYYIIYCIPKSVFLSRPRTVSRRVWSPNGRFLSPRCSPSPSLLPPFERAGMAKRQIRFCDPDGMSVISDRQSQSLTGNRTYTQQCLPKREALAPRASPDRCIYFRSAQPFGSACPIGTVFFGQDGTSILLSLMWLQAEESHQ